MKAIIFDLNGVFIQSPYLSDRFASDFGVSTEDFLPALSKIMAVVRQKDAESMHPLWKPYFEEWNVELSEEEFLDYWFSAESENKEMTDFARKLKTEGWKLFVLSNNFRERVDYYRKNFQFLELFDKAYFSCESGNVKPDVNCFKQILEENKIESNNCFYFDDSSKNVEAAKKLGIKASKYEGLKQVKEIIN